MRVERRLPSPPLRPFLIGSIEGWVQTNATQTQLREVPFPGVPLIFGLETAWEIDGPRANAREATLVAGLHEGPTLVRPTASSWSCVELRLTPTAAHRILGLPMHELANRTVALADLVPEADELVDRLREAPWPERFDLVERFLLRRLDADRPLPRARRPRTQGRGTRDPLRLRGLDAAFGRRGAGGGRIRVRVLRPGAHEPRLPRARRHDAERFPLVTARVRRRRGVASIPSKTGARQSRTLPA
jgi:hypothetical protein